MVILSLALCQRKGSISLYDTESKKILTTEKLDNQSHCEQLIPFIEKMRHSYPKPIAAYVTTQGPGSFTGLRIAFSTLKALSMVQKKPIITVSSSEIQLLKFLSSNKQMNGPINVLIQMSLTRWVIEKFKVNQGEIISYEGTSLITSQQELKTLSYITQDITSEDVASFYESSPTQKSFQTIDELINLNPIYVGTQTFTH